MAYRRRTPDTMQSVKFDHGPYDSRGFYRENEDEDEIDSMMGMGSRFGRGRSRGYGRGGRYGGAPGWAGAGGQGVARGVQRGTQFFEPDAGLSSQPFFGFPGGAPAWAHFKETGQLAPGVEMRPEQRQYYARKAMDGAGSPLGMGREAPSGDILGAILAGKSSGPAAIGGNTSFAPPAAQTLSGSLGGTMNVPLGPTPQIGLPPTSFANRVRF